MSCFRHCVSQDRTRFVDAEYDLDLTYITERLIASGCPAFGAEQCVRNPHAQLLAFLESRCPGQNYYVINLCSEEGRFYEGLFDDRVFHFPAPDHFAAPLELVCACAMKIAALMMEPAKPTVLVHCKAGKGRSGVMICAALMVLGRLDKTPTILEEVKELFATKRGRGIKLACQNRVLQDFDALLSRSTSPMALRVPLNTQRVDRIVVNGSEKREITAEIWCSAGQLHIDEIRRIAKYSAFGVTDPATMHEIADSAGILLANRYKLRLRQGEISPCSMLLYNNVCVELTQGRTVIGRLQFFVGFDALQFTRAHFDDDNGIESLTLFPSADAGPAAASQAQ